MAIVLAMKFIFLFLNLAKIHILFLNVPSKGGSTDLGNIPKKKQFFLSAPLGTECIMLWLKDIVRCKRFLFNISWLKRVQREEVDWQCIFVSTDLLTEKGLKKVEKKIKRNMKLDKNISQMPKFLK